MKNNDLLHVIVSYVCFFRYRNILFIESNFHSPYFYFYSYFKNKELWKVQKNICSTIISKSKERFDFWGSIINKLIRNYYCYDFVSIIHYN